MAVGWISVLPFCYLAVTTCLGVAAILVTDCYLSFPVASLYLRDLQSWKCYRMVYRGDVGMIECSGCTGSRSKTRPICLSACGDKSYRGLRCDGARVAKEHLDRIA